MIHDLTLEQKIEVAAEQIENSLDICFTDEKKQIRLILTQFAQELVSGDDTKDSGLHLQRVSGSLPDEFYNCLPQGYKFVNEEPLIDDIYDASGNKIDGEIGVLLTMRRQ